MRIFCRPPFIVLTVCIHLCKPHFFKISFKSFVKKTFKHTFLKPPAVSNSCVTVIILQCPSLLELNNNILSTPDLMVILLCSVSSDIHCTSGGRVKQSCFGEPEYSCLQHICLKRTLYVAYEMCLQWQGRRTADCWKAWCRGRVRDCCPHTVCRRFDYGRGFHPRYFLSLHQHHHLP
jgi:hypothetical protein